MKSLLKSAIGIMTLGLIIFLSMPAKAQPGVSVSMQTFYDDLAPYGEWIDDPNYGYVWRPDASGDFRPYYSGGHWVMTEYGNTWVSDYDWGWAPFHYGRWTYDSYYGWLWIPDTEWGPAWVSWRDGGGNYGWAPMGPNVSLSISFGNNYYVPNDWWVFVPYTYMYSPTFYRHYRGPRYNTTIINQTTIINNSYHNRYSYGPRPTEFQGHTGQRPNVYRITNINRPQRTQVTGNTVNLYRPRVTQGSGSSFRPQKAVQPTRPINATGAVNNPNPRAAQTRPSMPGNTQVERPATNRDMNRNDVRTNNNAPQARPNVRPDRQQAQSQQQAIENNRQAQYDQQRQQQAQQAQRQQQVQQAQQAQKQQQMEQQRQQVQQQQAQRQQDQQRQQQVQQAQQAQRQQQQQQAQQAQRQQQMEQQRQQQAQQQQMQRQQMDQQRQQQAQQQQMQRQQRQQQMQQRQQMDQQRQQPQPQRQQAPPPQRTEQRAPQQAQPQGERNGRFR